MARISYPETRTVDHVDHYHGTDIADPYRWLEETDSPEVLDWAKAQTALTESILREDARWRMLRHRLAQLAKFSKVLPPKRAAGRLFWFENDGTTPQPVLYMQTEPDSEPVVVLDVNTLSEDGTVAAPVFQPSPDGRLVTYGVAEGGSDWTSVHIRDAESGEDLPEVLERTRYTPTEWLPDSAAFYYARYPEETGSDLRMAEIRLHRIGTPQSDDELIFSVPDMPALNFSPKLTDDQKYLVLHPWEHLNGNRVWVLPLDEPETIIKLWDTDDDEIRLVGNIGTRFYFATNHQAPRGRVVAIDLDQPGVMREVVAESETVITGAFSDGALCVGKLAVLGVRDVVSRIDVYALDGTHEGEITLPTLGTIGVSQFDTQDTADFYIRFESFAYPPTVYRVDVTGGELEPFRPPKLDFDPSSIEVKQVFYPSKDGTRVPMFLVSKQGLTPNGAAPVYMTAYGGFAVPVMASFGKQGAPWMAWLELGGLLAIPGLRGGSEYGEDWHKAGMLDKKQTVFDDFHAAAEWLVANGYTSRARLGIEGGSNGGLLTSAAITQRPDLYGAAVVAVPLTDMLRYQNFTIGRLWVAEYGSSADPEQFEWIRAYSPLHNLKPGANYPPTLVTTGTHDDRVVPAHAYKFAAAMQAAQGGNAPVLLHVETRVGHGIGKPLPFILDAVADELVFFAQQFGMEF